MDNIEHGCRKESKNPTEPRTLKQVIEEKAEKAKHTDSTSLK
jgi:hypothetical protein